MFKLTHLLSVALIACCLSCQSRQEHNYAIKDFRKSLQPFLSDIVSKGIVTYYDSSEMKRITNAELTHLGQSENPILRAVALMEMLKRSSFNTFEVVMGHLDDTAVVAIDAGEFGIWFRAVSDYLLERANWKTAGERSKTIEQVLTRHNYLRSAYTILRSLEPQEKYYTYIKDMATRPRRLDDEGYEMAFGDIEHALYGLAKFKKPGDINIVKGQMMQNAWQLSELSFRLIKNFPDTAYFDVLKIYYRRQFYQFSGHRAGDFTGFFIPDRASPEDFIKALVMQESEKSAALLDTMLTDLPAYPCLPDQEAILNNLITEIWEHPCLAYTDLRKKIQPRAEEILKGWITISPDSAGVQIDRTEKVFRW